MQRARRWETGRGTRRYIMRHRITFLKHVDDALWLVVRCARLSARAVRFRNETQFGGRERTAVWGFLCEHRANPTALNVRSAPARRARCGDRRRSVFPPRGPGRRGAARPPAVPRYTRRRLCGLAARPILRPVRKLEARPRIYAVSAPSSTARSSSQFAHRRTTSGEDACRHC